MGDECEHCGIDEEELGVGCENYNGEMLCKQCMENAMEINNDGGKDD